MSQNIFGKSEPLRKINSESGSEEVHYPIFYEELPEEFSLIAKQRLNETEVNKREGLKNLKEFTKRENLPYIGEQQLLAVLRNCKYDIRKSETKLKKYASRREEFKNILRGMSLEKIENIIDDMGFAILPYTDKHGRWIFCTRPCYFNFERYDIYDVAVLILASAFVLLNCPLATVAGITYFADCRAPSLYVFYPIFKAMKKFVPHLLSAPIRLPRIEILYENHLVRCFCQLMKSILSKKVVMSFHGDSYDSLHQLYDPSILPEEFGGNLGPLNTAAYKEKLLTFIKDFIEENV